MSSYNARRYPTQEQAEKEFHSNIDYQISFIEIGGFARAGGGFQGRQSLQIMFASQCNHHIKF